MIKSIDQRVSKIALAVVISGIFLCQPAHAETHSMTVGDHTISVGKTKHHNDMDRVEQRIKTMHDKLNLTAGQESQWNGVAQIMRDNEADIHQLVISRHENEPANAVEDLQSYETIAETLMQTALRSSFRSLRPFITTCPMRNRNAPTACSEGSKDAPGTRLAAPAALTTLNKEH